MQDNLSHVRVVLLSMGPAPFPPGQPLSLALINGRPLFTYHLQMLERQGFRKITILSDVSDKLKSALVSFNSSRLTIDYLPYLKTGGVCASIKNVPHDSGQDKFVLIRGDMISTMNMTELVFQHNKNYSVVTVPYKNILTWTKKIITSDVFSVCLNGFELEKVDVPTDVGVYLLSASVLDYLPVESEILDEMFPAFLKNNLCLNSYMLSSDVVYFKLYDLYDLQRFMQTGMQQVEHKIRNGWDE